jgi:pimeloyl-ACP methyl ester carboxylesterase
VSGFVERRFSAQDGLLLYAREYGDARQPGVPALCLTGLTRNCKDFHSLATHLSAKRRVLCPDYRGRGRSAYDADCRNYDPRVYLDDVRHLLAVAQMHRFVAIGTSMGGLLAAALGCFMPGALAGVVMNDTGPDLNPDGLGRIFAYIAEDRPQRDLDSAARHLRLLFPNLSFKDDEGWREMAEGTFRRGDDGLWHFDWDVNLAKPLLRHGAPRPDLWAIYRSLGKVPTVAIRGGLSDVLTAETFDRMEREKPDLVRVTIPGVGHTPTLAEPAARAAIDALFAGLDGA